MLRDAPPLQPVAPPCTVGVLVATFHRTEYLARCLNGLATQRRPPDDVIVVVRDGDWETRRFLTDTPMDGLPVRMVIADQPGLVYARNLSIVACRTDILAMLDDDAVPHNDWLARISDCFAHNPCAGGVGGRDRCHDGVQFDDGRKAIVGKIQWFGRTIGNHHLGFGLPREVDILKGANMSYRMTAIRGLRFNTCLRGSGAQPHDDLAFSVAVRRNGWSLLYDPEIIVDHYVAKRHEPRHYHSVKRVADFKGFSDHAFNSVIAIWDDLTLARRVAYVLWSSLIGTGMCPGLLQAVRYTPRLGLNSWRRLWSAQSGQFQAYRQLMRMARRGPMNGSSHAV